MFEQDRTFREALSDKTKARFMGIKEKFTPLNIVRMLTGSGGIGRSIRTVAGRSMGYSERDIQYFGGYKRKRSIYGPDRSRVPAGSKSPVKVNDSTADILAKIYNLMRKIDEDNTRRYEKEKNFEEENVLEDEKRHEKVLDALGVKNKKVPGKIEKPKEEDEKNGFLSKIFGSIFGVFKKVFSFFKVIGEGLLTILTIGGLVKTLSLIGEMFKTPIKLFSNILISLLPIFANLLWGVFRNPIKLLAAGVIGTLIFGKDTDFAKGLDFSKYKNQLPGSEKITYDKDTGKETGRFIEGGQPQSQVHAFKDKSQNDTEYDNETFYKLKTGQKNIYDVPLIGSFGQEAKLALTNEEALELFKTYQKYEESHKRFLDAEKSGNKERITNATDVLKSFEQEANELILKHLSNTWKNPMKSQSDAFGFTTGRSKFLLSGDKMVSLLFGKNIGELTGEFDSTIKSVYKSMGIDTTKNTLDKTIDDVSKELKKLEPIIEKLKGVPNIMESDEIKALEEHFEKQKTSVINLNQKNTTQQQSNLKGIEIRDTKLLESVTTK
jgi:hypothetical protein